MGECLRCGKCCTSFGVCVTPFDIRRLSLATGLPPSSFVMAIPEPPERERAEPAVIIDGVRSLIVLAWKGPKSRNCFFYYASGCMAYDERPMLCRTYPFRSCPNGLIDMKSRACPSLWQPERAQKAAYLKDITQYEKEISAYIPFSKAWNDSGGGTLAQFLSRAMETCK